MRTKSSPLKILPVVGSVVKRVTNLEAMDCVSSFVRQARSVDEEVGWVVALAMRREKPRRAAVMVAMCRV